MLHLQALLLPGIRSSAAKLARSGDRQLRMHVALLAALFSMGTTTAATAMMVSMFLENNR